MSVRDTHELKYIQNDEVTFLRHIVGRRKEGGSNELFFITTWPGHLCVSGDMGTYVFWCNEDMLAFFNGGGGIDYLASKLVSGSIPEGVKKFSNQKVKEYVLDFEMHDIDFTSLSSSDQHLLIDLANDDYCSAIEAFETIKSFEFVDGEQPFEHMEYHGGIFESYTPHFKWCVEAILWVAEQHFNENWD